MNTNASSSFCEEISLKATEATGKLIPTKSATRYEKEYEEFCEWKKVYKVQEVQEDVMLAYFLDAVSVKLCNGIL